MERTKTVQLNDTVGGHSRLEHVELLSSLYTDVFMLFLAHQPNPVVVTNPNEEISLGRYSEAAGGLTIDLEEFGGAQLGVSRRHARIRRDAEGSKLEDLGSKNGTWLNGVQLEPLVPYVIRSGDEIRLGQMITHAYFNRSVNRVQSMVLINIKYSTARLTHTRLAYEDVTQDLAPFLRALGDAQVLIYALGKREKGEINIDAIVTDKQSGTITVTIEGANDIIPLLRDRITPWRRANRALIENKDAEFQNKVKELVLELIRQLRTDAVSTEDQKNFAERLFPLVQTFIHSNMELSVEQPIIER